MEIHRCLSGGNRWVNPRWRCDALGIVLVTLLLKNQCVPHHGFSQSLCFSMLCFSLGCCTISFGMGNCNPPTELLEPAIRVPDSENQYLQPAANRQTRRQSNHRSGVKAVVSPFLLVYYRHREYYRRAPAGSSLMDANQNAGSMTFPAQCLYSKHPGRLLPTCSPPACPARSPILLHAHHPRANPLHPSMSLGAGADALLRRQRHTVQVAEKANRILVSGQQLMYIV